MIALARAASVDGTAPGGTTARFSRPVEMPRPEVTVIPTGAPAICVAVSTLPTRSTTTIVAGAPRAVASLIACNTIVLTSLAVRLGLVLLAGAAGTVAWAAERPTGRRRHRRNRPAPCTRQTGRPSSRETPGSRGYRGGGGTSLPGLLAHPHGAALGAMKHMARDAGRLRPQLGVFRTVAFTHVSIPGIRISPLICAWRLA